MYFLFSVEFTSSMSLFRKEVSLAKRPRLYGDVILSQPIAFTALTALLALFVVLGGAIALTGEYTRSEQAIGHIVPTTGLVKVYPSRAGTVSFLNVHEGKHVSKDEQLAFITIEQSNLMGSSPEFQGIKTLHEQAELLKEKLAIIHDQGITKIDKIKNERDTLQKSIEGLNRRKIQQKEIASISNEALKRTETLASSGNISKLAYEERKRATLSAEQSLEIISQEIISTSNRVDALVIEERQAGLDQKQSINQIKSEILNAEQRIFDLESNRAYALTAPVTGKATTLLTSLGRSVSPQTPLLTIIPDGGELIAELFVPSRTASFVKIGQEVKLTFEAFPYQDFGFLPATITSVTSTILLPSEADASISVEEPVYRVLATLQTDKIKSKNTAVELQPGMRLQATIVLEKMKIIDRYLNPLKAWSDRL